MTIRNARFVTSAAGGVGIPDQAAPEIVMIGRSNVGKSSLINFLAGQKALARVGSTPGRTRLLNFFSINDGEFSLVDLPGYGFQAGSRKDAAGWDDLLGGFLERRKTIRLALFLVDLRHEPSDGDMRALKYLGYLRIPFCVVAAKADKVPASRRPGAVQKLDSFLGVGKDNIVLLSVPEKLGKEDLLERLERALRG
jgi:GTP-binding protein